MHYLSRLARYISDLNERGIETLRYKDPKQTEHTIIAVKKDGVEFQESIKDSSLSDDVFVFYILRRLVERLENCLAHVCGECARYTYDREYDIYWCNRKCRRIELHDVACEHWKESD